MELAKTETMKNLMRAFSGETQARARYEYAAAAVNTQGFPALERLFRCTAKQEKEHAETIWKRLTSAGVECAAVNADYPLDLTGDALGLLRLAAAHEAKEAQEVYPAFADAARREGFAAEETLFRNLAEAERLHGRRFTTFADLLESGKLFAGEGNTAWICLYCGHVVTGAEPPEACPLCSHPKGGFLRLEQSPFQ